jgi:perosamine synthetase
MTQEYIPVNSPLLNGNEKKYLTECIDTGWISSEGPFVKKFEENFALKFQRRKGVAVCNGTAAIDAAIEALQIGNGDEVIVPSFTIISCILQLVRSGAKPVLVDADPLTWNIDVTQVEAKINQRTRAIMVVHIYGLPVDMDPILTIAERHGLWVIEDAAEAIGQEYRGRPCGSFGNISTVSFYPNKHVTTGEGGMILTNDDVLYERCISLRNLCFDSERRFLHRELGWNFRMTSLQAALGLAQLERLDEFVSIKRRNGSIYKESLSDLVELQLPLHKTDYATNIYWVFGVVLQPAIKFDAEFAIRKLGQMGIGCRPFFFPLHQQPILNRLGLFHGEKYPVSELLSLRGFYIPSGLGLKEEQIFRVVEGLKNLLSSKSIN